MLQIYGKRHLFRLAPEVLFDSFSGYPFAKGGHPMKKTIEKDVALLLEAGIAHHIRER